MKIIFLIFGFFWKDIEDDKNDANASKKAFFILMLFFFTIFGFFKKHFENKVNKLGYDNGEKIYGHGVGLFS